MASDDGVETIEMLPPPPLALATTSEPATNDKTTTTAAATPTTTTMTTTLIVTPPPGERMPLADEASGITIMATPVDNAEVGATKATSTTTTAHMTISEKRLSNDGGKSNAGGGLRLAIGHQDSGGVDEQTKFIPALPNHTHHLLSQAAAAHGGDESVSFLQQEINESAQQQQLQLQQQQRLRSASSTLDASISRNPSTAGKHDKKKLGHRRVDEGGEVTYKKIQSKQIMGSIQLGIQHTVGILASKPKRDLLMKDFWEMETISFPPDGSSLTPAHHYSDFRFKVYAPIAFRYFRDLFGIAPDDFLMSLCAAPLRQLSNPGASGSIFYLTNDDEFIIKTVQKKECEFLQKLLPGYYMNLSQNPRTLLPKFFGLYCFHYNTKNVRLVAMNNLLPSDIKMHAKYDLKGSTFRRKASKTERQKASPTFKDLDFMDHYPNGIFLEPETYNALMNTIKRDCMVLESFQIMDYSLLVGIHNLDIAQKEKREERIRNARAKLQRSEEIREMDDAPEADQAQITPYYGASSSTSAALQAAGTALNRSRSMNRQRLVAHSTAMESITADIDAPFEGDEDVPAGGIPARSEKNDRLILYIGIIDILQSYRFEKKLEHTFKSIIYNGETVSVCRPSFYAQRFQNFMAKTVFKNTPTFSKNSPLKRKVSTPSTRTVQRTPSQNIMSQGRPPVMSGSSTPPPAFDDISEEDVTASSSNGGASSAYGQRFNYQPRKIFPVSTMSSSTNEYSDDDLASNSETRSPALRHNPRARLSKTDVQLTSIGCQDEDVDDSEDDEKRRHFSHSNSTTSSNQPTNDTIDSNGKAATNTNTVIKSVKSPMYTTTLVLNDVR